MSKHILQDETLAKKFVTKGSISLLFIIITAPLGYLIKVIVSNVLSVEDVGLFYSIIGFVLLLSMYNDLGLTESLQYFLPKYRIQKQYNAYTTSIVMTLAIQMISGFIIAILLFFGADRLATYYFKAPQTAYILKIFCFYFLLVNISQVTTSILYAFQDIIYVRGVELIRFVIISVATIILRQTHTLSLDSYTYAWFGGLIIALIVSVILVLHKYGSSFTKGRIVLKSAHTTEHIRYAFWVFLGANAGTLLGQIDQQFIILFLNPTQAGYYSNFLSLLSIYNTILSPVMMLLFPIVTELITKKLDRKIHILQNMLYHYTTLFSLSLGALFTILGPEIALIFFGVKFIPSGNLLQYIGIFIVLQGYITFNFSFLAGMGKVKQRVIILARATGINCLLNLLLLPTIGIVGAIISTIAGRSIIVRLTYRILSRMYPITRQWNKLITSTCYITILTLAIYSTKIYLFSYSDAYRYSNILSIVILGCIYYISLGLMHYTDIRGVIKAIRENR